MGQDALGDQITDPQGHSVKSLFVQFRILLSARLWIKAAFTITCEEKDAEVNMTSPPASVKHRFETQSWNSYNISGHWLSSSDVLVSAISDSCVCVCVEVWMCGHQTHWPSITPACNLARDLQSSRDCALVKSPTHTSRLEGKLWMRSDWSWSSEFFWWCRVLQFVDRTGVSRWGFQNLTPVIEAQSPSHDNFSPQKVFWAQKKQESHFKEVIQLLWMLHLRPQLLQNIYFQREVT